MSTPIVCQENKALFFATLIYDLILILKVDHRARLEQVQLRSITEWLTRIDTRGLEYAMMQ